MSLAIRLLEVKHEFLGYGYPCRLSSYLEPKFLPEIPSGSAELSHRFDGGKSERIRADKLVGFPSSQASEPSSHPHRKLPLVEIPTRRYSTHSRSEACCLERSY